MPTRCFWPPDSVSVQVRLAVELDAAQAFHGDLDVLAREDLQPREQRRHGAQAAGEHVLADRQPRHHVVVLEDHRHLAPHAPQAGAARLDARAVDMDLALGGRAQAVDAAQQGGLAGARRAQHDQEFAGRHVEVDAAKGLEIAIALGQASDLDHFMPLRSSFSTRAVSRMTS
jgi:hypothetical protein